MRTTIHISKATIFFLVIFILGSYFFISGLISMQKEKKSVNFNDVVAAKNSEGDYVVGEIKSFLIKNVDNLGNGTISGISQTLFTAGNEYYFYTVPIKNNMYIRVMVSDKKMIESLNTMEMNKENGIYFEGEIIKTPLEINYNWYDEGNLSTNNIISNYVVKEINTKNKAKMIYVGFLLLFTSFIQFKVMGGIKSIFLQEKIMILNPTRIYHDSYNKENELIIENINLEKLYKELRSLKAGCLIRIPLVLFGVQIFISNIFWELKSVGLLFIFFSVKGIAKFLLNVGWKSSDRIMHFLNRISLSERINRKKEKIAFLEKELNKSKDNEFAIENSEIS